VRTNLQRLVDTILGSADGRRELRRAAAARAAELGGGVLKAIDRLPTPFAHWVETVARHAWRITDEDVASLKSAGFDEDAIFEATVAAAVGAGIARYQVAMRAIADAKESAPPEEARSH
jgi:hypothetical protein